MNINVLREYWPILSTVYLACLVAFTSPGPNFVAISSYSLENRISGLGVASGISVGTGLWALLAATGITAVLSTFQQASYFVSILGGLYLIWLGYKSISAVVQNKAKFTGNIDKVNGHSSFFTSFRTGLAIQLTNPKTALFWLALTSTAIQPETPLIPIVALVIGCIAIALVWHISLAFVFSTGKIRDVYVGIKPIISCVFGVLFLWFGFKVLLNALEVNLV